VAEAGENAGPPIETEVMETSEANHSKVPAHAEGQEFDPDRDTPRVLQREFCTRQRPGFPERLAHILDKVESDFSARTSEDESQWREQMRQEALDSIERAADIERHGFFNDAVQYLQKVLTASHLDALGRAVGGASTAKALATLADKDRFDNPQAAFRHAEHILLSEGEGWSHDISTQQPKMSNLPWQLMDHMELLAHACCDDSALNSAMQALCDIMSVALSPMVWWRLAEAWLILGDAQEARKLASETLIFCRRDRDSVVDHFYGRVRQAHMLAADDFGVSTAFLEDHLTEALRVLTNIAFKDTRQSPAQFLPEQAYA